MVAVKESLHIFVHRTVAYNYSHHIGLIAFSSAPELAQKINDVTYDISLKVNDIQSSSETALWKSLELAKDELAKYAVKYERARRCILILSDGEDTVSDSYGSQK